MNKKLLLLLLLLLILGCGPKVHFIKVGNEYYPPKQNDYEVLVFLNDVRPEKEYKVVGMVFIETESALLFPPQISDSKVINKLKKEAKKRGADAIIDLKITSDTQVLPDNFMTAEVKRMKRAQAKAIVFINNNNDINK